MKQVFTFATAIDLTTLQSTLNANLLHNATTSQVNEMLSIYDDLDF